MERLSDTPAAANNALAALSIAFEFDLKKARDAMLPVGAINPCIRISKYESFCLFSKAYTYNSG